MPVKSFAVALMFGTLSFTSMQNVFATSISISTATLSTQNQNTDASSTPAKPKQLTVTGKLQKSMGIGGESTGWTIALDSQAEVDGQSVDSIEVQGANKKLESFADQRVEASGVIVHKTGVERGSWPVLQIKKIKKAKASATTALEGTRWKLIELHGQPAVKAQGGSAAEILLKDKRASGSSGCNRVTGGYESSGDSLHFSPMAMTRMACIDEAVNKQEQVFVEALQSTTAYRITGAKLELLRQQEVVAKFEAQ